MENLGAQRDRIFKEVRESLTQQKIAILAEFFKPAFDAGLWRGSQMQVREKNREERFNMVGTLAWDSATNSIAIVGTIAGEFFHADKTGFARIRRAAGRGE